MTETLTNFPLYVYIDPSGNGAGIGGKIQDTGNDIRFTSSDGTTLLPYERESYAEASSNVTANFWVGVTLNADDDASTDDTIYLYYGNAGAADGKDVANGSNDVWDGNFEGVWHLSGATLSALDSTGNSNDGTNNGATATTGKVGNGGSFDGTNDYITIPDSTSWDFGTGQFSISLWFKKTSEARGDIFSKKSADANDDVGLILEDDETMDVYFKTDSVGDMVVSNGNAFSVNAWHYASLVRDGSSNLTTYIDGTPDGTGTSNGNLNNNAADIWIGSNHDNLMTPSFAHSGLIDEIRISSVARSAAWTDFEYDNMNEADNRLTSAAEEDAMDAWAFRKTITIDHTNVSATLTDFPLAVKINQDANLGANAQSDGDDIRFTSDDGVTILSYERESWRVRSGSGSGDFWVKVPSISHTTDTTIYVYYGKADAANGQARTSVWDSDFKGVYHLSGSALSVLDSTSNARNGTNVGATATTGQVDGAAALNGTSQKINAITDPSLANANFSISSWVKRSSATGTFDPVIGQGTNSANNGLHFTYRPSNVFTCAFWGNDLDTTVTYTDTGWHFFECTYNAATNTRVLYVDGVAQNSDTATADYQGTGNMEIGYSTALNSGSNEAWFPGTIDEARISTSVRSAAWVKFEYYNMGEADAELSFGAQVAVNDATAPSVSALSPADNATAVSVTANLVITFDEAVDPEAGASNDITIKKTSNNETVETIDAQDAKVTGGGTTTITVNPAATLNENTEYYVLIGADAFDDSASNSYAGISSTTAWSFTTSDLTNPSISFIGATPADASYQSGSSITIAATTSDNGGVHSVINDWNSSLKGWWRLNGDLSDSSGNGNTASNNGATSTATGKLGGAYSFDGNDYLDMGIPSATQAQTSITLSAWVKSSDTSAGYRDIIANQWQYQNSGIMLTTNGASTIHIPFSNGSALDSLDATYTVADGNWHHLAVTFNAGAIVIYADGVSRASKTSTIATQIGYNGSNHLLIGKDSGDGGTEYWNGSIDDVQIYSRSLGSDEILALYNASANQYSHTFTGLSNGSSYTFKTYAQDVAGNVASVGPRTFSVDSTAPTISSITTTPAATSVTVTWTTDEAASSRVQYGTTDSFGQLTDEADTSPRVTSPHSMTISGLPSCTLFSFRPVSADAAGNSVNGTTGTFTTLGCTNSATVSDQERESITNGGGELSLTSDGLETTLSAPADGARPTLTFQIKKIDSNTVIDETSSPSGTTIIGDLTYDIKAINGTTLVTSFIEPITVTMEYTDAQVSGYTESTLQIYRWNGDSWNALSNCSVDMTANIVSCTTTNFSTFGLFGRAVTTTSNSTTTPSNGGRRGDEQKMAVRIAEARNVIIARFEGKRRKSVEIAVKAAAPDEVDQTEQGPKERTSLLKTRIEERQARIAQIEQIKKAFEEKFTLHQEKRFAKAAAEEQKKIQTEQEAILAEQEALKAEEVSLARHREERLSERIMLDAQEHAQEVTAAKEREARIAAQVAAHEAEIARIEKNKKEFESAFALHLEERMTKAAKEEEKKAQKEQAALEEARLALKAEQEANAWHREERMAEHDRSETEKQKNAASSLEELAARRGRLYAIVDETPVLFEDVSLNEWYAPYVSLLVDDKIATGYADETGKPKGEFGVTNAVTYAEMLKMALLAASAGQALQALPPPRNTSTQGTWAASFVAQAEDMNLSVFLPSLDVHKPATRGAVIQTILEVMNIPIANRTPEFTDVTADHPYARSIATAAFYGLISGDMRPDGSPRFTFRPDEPINRAEVAKIIALLKEME